MDATLDWVGQSVLVAAAARLLVRLPQLDAATRVTLRWLALLLIVLLPFAPLTPAVPSFGRALEAVLPAPNDRAAPRTAAAEPAPDWRLTLPVVPAFVTTGLMGVWIAGTLFALWRTARAAAGVRRLRHTCVPVAPEVESTLVGWRAASRDGRRAALVTSPDACSAAVLGLGAPLIVLPTALLRDCPAGDLDQIVLHELAHVQRRDDCARFGERLAAAILWWHPGVHLVLAGLDADREAACDDWVVRRTRAPRRYAESLARAAELLCPRAAALSPRLQGEDGELVARVRRLLDPSRCANALPSHRVASALALALVAAAGSGLDAVAVPRPAAPPRGATDAAAVERRDPAAEPAEPPAPDASTSTPVRAVPLPLASPPPAPPIEAPRGPTVAGEPEPLDAGALGAGLMLVAAPVPPPSAPTPDVAEGEVAGPATVESPWRRAAGAGTAVGDAGGAVGEQTADAGVAIARGTARAGTAAAGFFKRLGAGVRRSF